MFRSGLILSTGIIIIRVRVRFYRRKLLRNRREIWLSFRRVSRNLVSLRCVEEEVERARKNNKIIIVIIIKIKKKVCIKVG